MACNHQKKKQLPRYHKGKPKCISHFGKRSASTVYKYNICLINIQRYTVNFPIMEFLKWLFYNAKSLLLINEHKIPKFT